MKVLLLDPGLSARHGHNAAVLEELCLHAQATDSLELCCAASRQLHLPDFANIRCHWLPGFRLHGYARFGGSPGVDDDPVLRQCLALCEQDLRALALERFDLVLMPTAYPFHLAGLAVLGRASTGSHPLRARIGLMMPPTFWASDLAAQAWLNDLMRDAIERLAELPGISFHAEVPCYAIGNWSVPTTMLLPPVSAATGRWAASQVAANGRHGASTDPAMRFGFLGEPMERKGFALITASLQAGVPANVRITLVLPAHHAPWVARLKEFPAARPMLLPDAANASYLKALGHIDVLLALYDPAIHRAQMSGIVAEAIGLGKAILVAEGCDAILEFLRQWAPGSFLVVPRTQAGLLQGLRAPASVWRRCQEAACRASAAVMRLKDVERYLAPLE